MAIKFLITGCKVDDFRAVESKYHTSTTACLFTIIATQLYTCNRTPIIQPPLCNSLPKTVQIRKRFGYKRLNYLMLYHQAY